MLIGKKLTAQQGLALMAMFAGAHGPEVMRRAYGWDRVRSRGKGERTWAFWHKEDGVNGLDGPIGWGSVHFNTLDADDEEGVLSLGVFPQYERRGFRVQIIDWLCQKVASEGAKRASYIVFQANEPHSTRTYKEIKQSLTTPWQHAGTIWYPESYHYYVRELQDGKSQDQAVSDATSEGARSRAVGGQAGCTDDCPIGDNLPADR